MKDNCLMNAAALPLGELICFSKQYQGIVFLNLGEENVPRFIVDLVSELEREKVTTTVSPCEIFESSRLIDRPHGHQRDLALTLKSADSSARKRLKDWVKRQPPDAVMLLSEYTAEYKDKIYVT